MTGDTVADARAAHPEMQHRPVLPVSVEVVEAGDVREAAYEHRVV